jgi:hypothetical protein
MRDELLKKVVKDAQNTEDGPNPSSLNKFPANGDDILTIDDVPDEDLPSSYEELNAFVSGAISKEEVSNVTFLLCVKEVL